MKETENILLKALIQLHQQTQENAQDLASELLDKFPDYYNVMKNHRDSIDQATSETIPNVAQYVRLAIDFITLLDVSNGRRLACLSYTLNMITYTDTLAAAWLQTASSDEPHFDFIQAQHTHTINLSEANQVRSLSKDKIQAIANIADQKTDFLATNYARILLHLEPLKGTYPETPKTWGQDMLSVKRRAAILFFVLSTDKDPAALFSLTDDELARTSVIFKALDYFLTDTNSPGNEMKTFFHFLWTLIDSADSTDQTPLQKTKARPTLNSIIPHTAVINNSKLAHELTRNFLGEGEIPILVSRRNAKKEVSIIASLDIDDPNIKIVGKQPYTAYDRAVLNGICSLWQAGNTAFTPAMVYRAMNGTNGTSARGEKVSPQAIEAVTQSIEKQRVTRLYIDCTEQMKHYKDLTSATYDAMMLTVEGIEMTAQNGEKVKAYRFTNPSRPPILYEYSRSIGQVLSVPPRLLNSSRFVRSTAEVITLREYLIRRIEGMKNKKNSLTSNKITYGNIYEELGIDPSKLEGDAKKNVPRRIRQNTEAILNHVTSEKYIAGYTSYKKGKTVIGIEVSLT